MYNLWPFERSSVLLVHREKFHTNADGERKSKSQDDGYQGLMWLLRQPRGKGHKRTMVPSDKGATCKKLKCCDVDSNIDSTVAMETEQRCLRKPRKRNKKKKRMLKQGHQREEKKTLKPLPERWRVYVEREKRQSSITNKESADALQKQLPDSCPSMINWQTYVSSRQEGTTQVASCCPESPQLWSAAVPHTSDQSPNSQHGDTPATADGDNLTEITDPEETDFEGEVVDEQTKPNEAVSSSSSTCYR